MTDGFIVAAALVFGLVVGSFMNVLIYRLPRGKPIVLDRSRCPECDSQISWYDNVPLVSYLLLRGRCRHCGFKIPKTYPLVETLSAVTAVVIVHVFGLSLKAIWLYVFVGVLIVITFIDWHHRIIPDVLSLGGVVFGWVGSLVCLDLTLIESLLGTLVGGTLLLVIAVLYKAIRKMDGMGGGDVKLMAMIGAFLGWQMIFPVLFVASLFGSIYGVYLLKRGGTSTSAVAFGSFLAPSATFVLVFGTELLQLYLGR